MDRFQISRAIRRVSIAIQRACRHRQRALFREQPVTAIVGTAQHTRTVGASPCRWHADSHTGQVAGGVIGQVVEFGKGGGWVFAEMVLQPLHVPTWIIVVGCSEGTSRDLLSQLPVRVEVVVRAEVIHARLDKHRTPVCGTARYQTIGIGVSLGVHKRRRCH